MCRVLISALAFLWDSAASAAQALYRGTAPGRGQEQIFPSTRRQLLLYALGILLGFWKAPRLLRDGI